MLLKNVQPALEYLRKSPVVSDLRQYTYLSTYPYLLKLAQVNNMKIDHLSQLTFMVYGWMPRTLRIDNTYLASTLNAVKAASKTSLNDFDSVPIQNIANCLRSVVGASKLLHFINPKVYPIWDSKIQAFRGFPTRNSNMQRMDNYLAYVRDVHAIVEEKGFNNFYTQFNEAYRERLEQSQIEVYKVGPLRAIELSVFELASRACQR